MVEAIGGYLGTVGIKTRMRTMERAAFYSALATKKLKGLCVCIDAVYGNASTRMAEVVPSDGAFAYGGESAHLPLLNDHGHATHRTNREATVHRKPGRPFRHSTLAVGP